MKFEDLSQNKENHSRYVNAYGIYFYHDFNPIEPLKTQIKSVRKKYNRRIKRFYRDIHQPTLFLRYVSSQEEADFIVRNRTAIDNLLKKFNKENTIVYVVNNEILLEDSFPVTKDKCDAVCRCFLKQNTDLMSFINKFVPEIKMSFYGKVKVFLEKKYRNFKYKHIKKNAQDGDYVHYKQYDDERLDIENGLLFQNVMK